MAPPYNAVNSLDEAILYESLDLNDYVDSIDFNEFGDLDDSVNLNEFQIDKILAKKVYKTILQGRIDIDKKRKKRGIWRKYDKSKNKQRDQIMEEFISISLTSREEEVDLGKEIELLEKNILSYLYSSHRDEVNEYFENLEIVTNKGSYNYNLRATEYRSLIREKHDQIVSESGEEAVQDLLWNFYQGKKDAKYIKEIIKLVGRNIDEEIIPTIDKWNDCLNELVLRNSSNSFNVAKKYWNQDKFLKWDDFFQESFLGLIRAAE